MTITPEKIHVVVVDDNTDTINNLKKLLYFEKDIEIVGTATSGDEGVKLAAEKQPDVVLMDINMPGMDGIAASEAISARVTGAQIVIMSVQAEPDYLRRAMLAGAREFLIKPFSSEQLANTVRTVYRLGANQRTSAPAPQQPLALAAKLAPAADSTPVAAKTLSAPAPIPVRPHAPPHPHGKVFVLFAANGGLGRSTLAANLAIALRDETRSKVALVDASLRFGDIGVLLNLTTDQTIAEIASAEGGPDTEILADLLVSHPSGIKVMPAPSSPEMAELVTPHALRTILTTLREKFDFVVVDTFTSLDEIILTTLDVADRILLLTTSEIPAIKNTKLFFEVTEALKYPPERTLLILNKYDARNAISPQDIQASIRHPVYAVIERDDRATTLAAQTGQPFVLNQKNAPVSVAVQRLAKLLTRPAVAPAAEGKPAAPAQRRGLFR